MNKKFLTHKAAVSILAILLCIALLEIGIRLAGFFFLSLQEYRNRLALKKEGSYRILCLGDSMTAGGYPKLLEEVLNERVWGIRFTVIDKAIPAANSNYIMSTLEENMDGYSPNMVICMMGFNDGKALLPYGNMPVSGKIPFKTYKLARIICYHLTNQAKKLGIFSAKKKRGHISGTAGGLKQSTNFEFPGDNNQYPKLNSLYMPWEDSAETEEMLKKVIEKNPGSYEAYYGLGWFYIAEGKFGMAEEMFKKAIELNPRNDDSYVGLGWLCMAHNEYKKAEEMFKKAIELNPRNDDSYVGLGWCYGYYSEYKKAEEMLKKAIKKNPKSDKAYFGLGRCYIAEGKHEKAEAMLNKAVEINSENYRAYLELAQLYIKDGKYRKAEEMHRKARDIMPKRLVLELQYISQGKYKKAVEIFKKYIEKNPNNDWTYVKLREKDGHSPPKERFPLFDRLRSQYYNPITRSNYQKLKGITAMKGIKLVCLQYPMLSIEPLKKMFDDKRGIVFVDNEAIFKEAIKRDGCDEYFTDMFGVNFGHCTRKGNILLAENIASVILKDFFGIYIKR